MKKSISHWLADRAVSSMAAALPQTQGWCMWIFGVLERRPGCCWSDLFIKRCMTPFLSIVRVISPGEEHPIRHMGDTIGGSVWWIKLWEIFIFFSTQKIVFILSLTFIKYLLDSVWNFMHILIGDDTNTCWYSYLKILHTVVVLLERLTILFIYFLMYMCGDCTV